MKLKQYIKLARKEKNFSLVYLANLSGLTYSMLYRIEDGSIIKPHPDILKKLAVPLEISYEQLLEYAGYITDDVKPAEESNLPIQQLPLLRWDSAIQFLTLPEKVPVDISHRSILTAMTQSPLFAIEITNHTYSPFFNPGEIILVHKTLSIKPLDYIIYLDTDENTIGLKQLRLVGKKSVLTSLSQQDPLPDIGVTKDVSLFRIIEKRF